MSNDREMDTKDVIHTCNGTLLSHKKENAICNNMDGLWKDYAKWNNSETDIYYMISLVCGIQ